MRRVAAHYIYCGRMYRMHYLEVDDASRLQGIHPLTEEIAGTSFYNGILIPLPVVEEYACREAFLFSLEQPPAFGRKECVFEALAASRVTDGIHPGMPVRLFLLNGLSLAASELGTDNRSGNGYIQRL